MRFNSILQMFDDGTIYQPGDIVIDVELNTWHIARASGSFIRADMKLLRSSVDGYEFDLSDFPDEVDALAFYAEIIKLRSARFTLRPTNCAVRRLVDDPAMAEQIARWARLDFCYKASLGGACSGVVAQFFRIEPGESDCGSWCTCVGENERGILEMLCRTDDKLRVPRVSLTVFYFAFFNVKRWDDVPDSEHWQHTVRTFLLLVDAPIDLSGDNNNELSGYVRGGVLTLHGPLNDAARMRGVLQRMCAARNSCSEFFTLLHTWPPVDREIALAREWSPIMRMFEATAAMTRQEFYAVRLQGRTGKVADTGINTRVLQHFRHQIALWLVARRHTMTWHIEGAQFRQPHAHRVYRDVVFAVLQATAMPPYCVLWTLDWLERAFNWRLTHYQRIRIIERVAASMRRVREARVHRQLIVYRPTPFRE